MKTFIVADNARTPHVTIKNNKAVTSSLDVANYFNKLHKNVIQKIHSVECSKEFNALNFKPVNYIDSKGEKRPMYEMTKDQRRICLFGYGVYRQKSSAIQRSLYC